MKKIAITGANSFIGGYFKNIFHEKYSFREIGLKENSLNDFSLTDVDIVFHVAAIVHQSNRILEQDYFKVNSDLATEVAKKAKKEGVKQFVFMSTVKVYGELNTKETVWTELSECFPVDSYGRSKLDAEKRLLQLNQIDFTVSIIRTPVVYGPNVKGNILKVIKLIDKIPILPFKGIGNIRAMVAIDNLAALIDAVIQSSAAGIYLASDERQVSSSELFGEIAICLNKRRFYFKIPDFFLNFIKKLTPKLIPKIYGSVVIDNTFTEKKLSFKPPITFSEGIKKTIDWYKKGQFQ